MFLITFPSLSTLFISKLVFVGLPPAELVYFPQLTSPASTLAEGDSYLTI
jgi:hypothetical protein